MLTVLTKSSDHPSRGYLTVSIHWGHVCGGPYNQSPTIWRTFGNFHLRVGSFGVGSILLLP